MSTITDRRMKPHETDSNLNSMDKIENVREWLEEREKRGRSCLPLNESLSSPSLQRLLLR